MDELRIILVFLLLARAVYTDLKKGIIENKVTIAGIIAGLIWSVAEGGMYLLLESCSVIAILFVLLFVLFLIKGLGAGDIKLFLALGAFFQREVIGIVIGSFFVAAGITLGKIIIRFFQKKKVYVVGETLNFSVPIAIATFIALFRM